MEKVKKTMYEDIENINKDKKPKKFWGWKITEMKNLLAWFRNRFEQEQERVSELESWTMEIIGSEEQKKKIEEIWTEHKGPVGHHQAD